MIYLILSSITVLYLCFAHMSYKYMCSINVGYFGEKTSNKDLVLPAMVWPIGLFIFHDMYKVAVSAVAEGSDWADIHIQGENRKIQFRKQNMTKGINA